METKRLFIAVEVPPAVMEEVERIQQFLKRKNLFRGNFVDPSKFHITLKFLGDVDKGMVPAIHERLAKIKCNSMQAQLGKLELFESKNNIPRVLYFSVMCAQLMRLAQLIDGALAEFFKSEERSFVNHLTVARIKQVHDNDKLKEIIDLLEVKPVIFDIDSFLLKESVLSSQGPAYSIVQRYSLLPHLW